MCRGAECVGVGAAELNEVRDQLNQAIVKGQMQGLDHEADLKRVEWEVTEPPVPLCSHPSEHEAVSRRNWSVTGCSGITSRRRIAWRGTTNKRSSE